jgi:hypothetical protein
MLSIVRAYRERLKLAASLPSITGVANQRFAIVEGASSALMHAQTCDFFDWTRTRT